MSDLFAAFGVNWKLLLVQAINFAVLLIILWRFLYRPILRMIDDRRAKIAEGVKTAEAAARRLQEAKAEGDTLVGEASREAENLVSTARKSAQTRAAEIVQGAEGQAATILKDAAARAEEAKRQALKESEKGIARAAILAAERILREKA